MSDNPAPFWKRDTRVALPLAGVILLAFAATAIAYWPGFMTWDAIRQYGQAVSGDFDDWHPPAMEWLWRRLIAIHAGPAPMLIVQLSLYWAGTASLAAWALHDRRRWLAVAIVACAAMPFPLALMGEVLKDCLMAGALLTATACLAWSDGERRSVRVAGIILLILASTLRFNAFLATVPLFVALLPHRWWQGRLRLGASILAATAIVVAALPLTNRVLDAKPSGVGLSLVIFDLAGITHFSRQNAFPKIEDYDEGDDIVGIVSACYDASKWDRYAWWEGNSCDIGFDNVGPAFKKAHVSPYRWWLGQVLAHPLAYAEHRLSHFNINTRLFSRDPTERPVQIDPPPNEWHYGIARGPLLGVVDAVAVWSADTPLGWPIVWIALALGLLILAPTLPTRRMVVPLALSSFLYGMGYGVFSVASELRYHLWTILAAAIAAVIAGSDLASGARIGRVRLALSAAPPLLILIACLTWRAAF